VLKRYATRIALAFLATSSMVALLPVVARQQLHTSASQFGVLSAAFGVGAVMAVWLLPPLKLRFGPDALIFGAGLLWSGGAVAVAVTGWIPLALVGVLCTGIGSMAAMNMIYSMFMTMLPAWIRGRASSVVMLTVWVGMSCGAALWGAIANAVEPRGALLLAAAFHLTVTAVVTSRFRLTVEQFDSDPPGLTS
jgi:MFS family permease